MNITVLIKINVKLLDNFEEPELNFREFRDTILKTLQITKQSSTWSATLLKKRL